MNKKIYRAGVLPYIVENDKIEMMFMMPNDPSDSYGGEEYQLAKGKVEEGEDDRTAAFREANEELGLFSGNVLQEYDLGTFLGRTRVYLAKIKSKDMFGEPCYETKKTKWLTLEEFLNVGRNLHKPMIKAAHRLITKKEALHEQELQEIELVHKNQPKGFNTKDFNIEKGVQIATAENKPVWKIPAASGDYVLYAIMDNETIISGVVGIHKTVKGTPFFMIQQAWTSDKFRRTGLLSSLYHTLYSKLHIKLISGTEQSPEMQAVWKNLPFTTQILDAHTGERINRQDMSDAQLYGNKRYQLIAEDNHVDNEFDVSEPSSTTLKDFIRYTYNNNKLI